jgi:hypothetical protein
MTEAATLAATEATETPSNVHKFEVPGTDNTVMQIEIDKVPPATRMDLLCGALTGYVRNSVNQAMVRHKKAMEPWDAYDKACAADPAQTAVPKPEGEMPTVDLIEVAVAARTRLYEGAMRKAGERKTRTAADPLTSMVTQAVVRELFEKKKATEKGYKYTDAVKEVGGNGIKYLDDLIAAKVAAGANADELNKFKESRYIQPAKLMLGQRDTAGTKGTSLF